MTEVRIELKPGDSLYHVLNPAGTVLGSGHDPRGIAKWCNDFVLILDDHAKYSVATYRVTVLNKATLVNQISVEDFCKQVREAFS